MSAARRGIRDCRIIGAFLLAIAAPAHAIDGPLSWVSTEVRAPQTGFYFSSPVLAFDHYGSPSLSWSFVSTSSGTNTVHCSQFSGLGIWTDREIASGSGIGLRTSLAFDRSERPVIAWVNDNQIVAGQFNFGASQQIATNADSTHPVVSLDYDLAGSLRGMTTATPSPAANFLSIGYSGGSFSSSQMFNLPGAGTIFDAAMTTDARGLRHVAAIEYLDGQFMSVLLASESSSGNWGSARHVTATEVNGLDIAVDPTDGRLALAYTVSNGAPASSTLYYAKFNGVTWQTAPVPKVDVGTYRGVSLAFDPADGRPAIAYEQVVGSSSKLGFAYLDASSAWRAATVDGEVLMETTPSRMWRPSLAFNDYGTGWPAIAYVDNDGKLKVAFDPLPEPGTAALLCLGLVLLSRRRPT